MIDIDDYTSPDKAIKALRRDSGADSQIVAGILKDLTDRKGIGDEWDSFDEDIQLEIIGEWLDIVRAAVKGGADSEATA